MAAPNEEDVRAFLPPTPQAAVRYYLRRLIAGEAMHPAVVPFIHDADVYRCAPGVLAARFLPTPVEDDRFFFTTIQRRRKGNVERYVHGGGRGPGFWSSQSQQREDILDEEGVQIGAMLRLRYKYRYGVATDWLMEEYHLWGWSLTEAVVGDREPVFCRIYVDPDAGADSEARQESGAFFYAAPPPTEEAAAVTKSDKKRPAPPIANKAPCPKRIRAAPMRRTTVRLVARRRRLHRHASQRHGTSNNDAPGPLAAGGRNT